MIDGQGTYSKGVFIAAEVLLAAGFFGLLLAALDATTEW